ncbi:MAG TPA: NAD-dependent epimerase/dehydratase family protein [Xanthobacteraceae bacterium]|nr:NAD-dependent epimerase/dehydratase family protein [Xanthobacteraceae bacterium]
MRVLILGGDGYLGWPTAMRLSKAGHEVMAVDSYLRRQLCREYSAEPLFEVRELPERARAWREKSGREIAVGIGDLNDWAFISEVFRSFRPDALVHYAEQPSAPFSMLDRSAAMLTLQNNLGVTLNVVYAVREFAPDCHIVKLGSMGEYGTPNIDIEEGWIEIEHKGRKDRFLFPRQGGSFYHATKVMDTDLLWLYVRVWGLRVTDLMQGPVYGFETHEAEGDANLCPFLNYDEIFGTVINRFVVQAVHGFPLTVYGAGGQTRGFLNLNDTLSCIELSIANPPATGELRVFNQFVETFTVNEIAQRVAAAGRQVGIDVVIKSVGNPRREAEQHYYNPVHVGLLSLGLKPHPLTEDVLAGMMQVVMRYRNRIDPSKFVRGIRWN